MLVSLQLLIIKGKNRFVNFKTVGIVLTTITIGTIVIPLIFIGVAIRDGRAVLCDSTIGCIGVDTSLLLVIFASCFVVAWVLSLSTLVAVTIWSCALFKKEYAGSDTCRIKQKNPSHATGNASNHYSNQYCNVCFISSCGYHLPSNSVIQLL